MSTVSHSPAPAKSFADLDDRLDDAEAYGRWLDDCEAELPDYEPELPDRRWWAEQVELMEGQRPNCRALPETLQYLDTQIAAARRYMLLAEVAEFLASTRADDTEGGAW